VSDFTSEHRLPYGRGSESSVERATQERACLVGYMPNKFGSSFQ
jgi:hypothetical protein